MKIKDILYIVISGFTALLSFYFGVLLTNNMSKTDYAYLQSAMGYAGIPLLLLPLGMEYILPKIRNELVGAFFSNYTLLSSLIAILSIVVLGFLDIQTHVYHISIVYVLSGITYTSFFEMYGEQLHLSIGNFIAIAIQVICFYSLIMMNLGPILAIILAYLCGNLTRFLLHYWFITRRHFLRLEAGKFHQFFKALKEIGVPMIGISLLGFTFGGFVRISVQPGDILADIGVVFQVVSFFSFWYGLIDKIYRYNLIARLDFIQFSKYFFFLLAPVLFFYLVCESLNLFSMIWGENYANLDSVTRLISLLLFSISLKHVSNIMANSIGKSKELLLINILSAIVFLALLMSKAHTLNYILGIISLAYFLTFILILISWFDSLYRKRI